MTNEQLDELEKSMAATWSPAVWIGREFINELSEAARSEAGLRELLIECRDELQENMDFEGRLASFARLIERIDAVLKESSAGPAELPAVNSASRPASGSLCSSKEETVLPSPAAGFVSVPVEPTEAMLKAGVRSQFKYEVYVPENDRMTDSLEEVLRRGWKAMLAAAKEGQS